MNKKKFISAIPRIVLLVILSFLSVRFVFGWTDSTAIPPGGSGGIIANSDQSGHLGIGTGNSGSALGILGGVSIGTNAGNTAVPAGHVLVEGKLGIGVGVAQAPILKNALSVGDLGTGVAIGTNYADLPGSVFTAGGMIIEGKMGIGTPTPIAKLDIKGGMRVGQIPQRGNWQTSIPNSIQTYGIGSGGTDAVAATVGIDGLPIVAYQDGGGLKVVKCVAPDCSSTGSPVTIASGNVGRGVAIAIDEFGFPNLSYYDVGNQSLQFVKCRSNDCTGSLIGPVTLAAGLGSVGFDTSMTFGGDGVPIVSFYDATNADLKVARCTGPVTNPCRNYNDPTFPPSINLIDGSGGVSAGKYSSIIIGADGKPIISYYYESNHELRIAKCTIEDCSLLSPHPVATIDTISGGSVTGTSITMGVDGLPIVLYTTDGASPAVKLAQCRTYDCDPGSGTTIPLVNTISSDNARYPILSILSEGVPFVGYETTANTFKAAGCRTENCAPPTLLQTIGSTGQNEALSGAIGADGLPVIFRLSSSGLSATHCGNPRCLPYWTRR